MSGEREEGARGGPHHAHARPGVDPRLAWVWAPPVAPQYLSGTFRPQIFQKKIKIRFLEFFEKLCFRGIFKIWQMLKSRKPKVEKVENQITS